MPSSVAFCTTAGPLLTARDSAPCGNWEVLEPARASRPDQGQSRAQMPPTAPKCHPPGFGAVNVR